MDFGTDRCAKASFKRGKLTTTADLDLGIDSMIKKLDQKDTCKYLGVNKGGSIQHSIMREKIRKEYYRRVCIIIKSELNAANRIEAIDTQAIPVVTYSFNIVDWKLNNIKRIDTKTRKILTMEKMHHPKADINRLYLPRASGGQGLVQLELTFKTTTIGLDAYLTNSDDPLLWIVKHQIHSINKEATQLKQEHDVPENQPTENKKTTTYAKQIKWKAKHHGQQHL